MRQIGSIDNEANARVFGDYLYVQGIKNDIEAEGNNQWAVWVHEEDQVSQAEALLQKFRQNPTSPEYHGRALKASRLRAEEEKEQKDYEKRYHDRGEIFPQARGYGPGPLTIMLIAGAVLVTLLSNFGHNVQTLQYLVISKFPAQYLPLAEVRQGELWRLFTPIFVHYSLAHIFFNMMWLFQLGSMIEARQSTFHLLALVAVIAVLSNVPQYFHSGPSFGGMSGVVYGLFGYIWIRGKCDPRSGLFIDRTNVILMIIWLFVCMTGYVGPIANVVHAVGLITGMAWGYISAKMSR